MTKVTFGADPEFFVKEKATGTIIPACGLFGGDKGSPILLNSNGGYLEDGVTIELNVAPCEDVSTLRQRLIDLKGLWEQRFPTHELVCEPYAEFTKATLRKHPRAMAIGCNADLCAWGIRRAPQISDFGPMRFAGGHIHVGIDPWPEGLEKDFLVRWLDMFALFPDVQHASQERYQHYGRPGLYRQTHYGIEWRSPDPSWVMGAARIADLTEMAVNRLMSEGIKNIEVVKARFAGLINNEELGARLAKPTQHDWYWLPAAVRQRSKDYLDWTLAA